MKQKLTVLIQQLKRSLRQIKGKRVKSPLPQGVEEFKAFVDDIMTTYDLPTYDRDSLDFVIATCIINIGSQIAFKEKWYFVEAIKAAASKQVASQVFQTIKAKQLEASRNAAAPNVLPEPKL
jgi:hypothetical protein